MELDGPFADGTTGTMVVRGQDRLQVRLVTIDGPAADALGPTIGAPTPP